MFSNLVIQGEFSKWLLCIERIWPDTPSFWSNLSSLYHVTFSHKITLCVIKDCFAFGNTISYQCAARWSLKHSCCTGCLLELPLCCGLRVLVSQQRLLVPCAGSGTYLPHWGGYLPGSWKTERLKDCEITRKEGRGEKQGECIAKSQ